MLRDLLRQEGTAVGRLHIATLMKRMRLAALYRRPNTSKPVPGHEIYTYLLRGLAVTRPNQVWETDMTPAFVEAGSTCLWHAASSISSRHRLVHPVRTGVAHRFRT